MLESPSLHLYERELSVRQQDIFFRKVEDHEIPLLLNFAWSLNQERKTLVLTDHDPNETHYSKCGVEQLRKKLESLEDEETEAVTAVGERFDAARAIMELRIKEMGLKRMK